MEQDLRPALCDRLDTGWVALTNVVDYSSKFVGNLPLGLHRLLYDFGQFLTHCPIPKHSTLDAGSAEMEQAIADGACKG